MRSCIEPSSPVSRRAAVFALTLLSLTAFAPNVVAQSPTADAAESRGSLVYRTFFLGGASRESFFDIQSDLRNMLPNAKLYGIRSEGAISILGSPHDIAMAEKILADLQHTRKAYRLVYTISQPGGGNPQKTALVVLDGSHAEVKQGSKVPLVTGSYTDNNAQHSEVQYMDLGLSIEATLDSNDEGIRLHTKMQEANISDERSGIGTQDPIFRQTTLESDVTLVPGKPLVLGTLLAPGSNLLQQIEVAAEPIP